MIPIIPQVSSNGTHNSAQISENDTHNSTQTPCQIFGVGNFTLNQYFGSLKYKMDQNSIFWVHKPEKRMNCGIFLSRLKILQYIKLYYTVPSIVKKDIKSLGLHYEWHLQIN